MKRGMAGEAMAPALAVVLHDVAPRTMPACERLLKAVRDVAPAWLMSAGTWSALEHLPLRYTCTLRRFVLLPHGRTVISQPVVYSTASAWRRGASLGWAALVARLQRGRPLLRLELHPPDAEHPAIRHSGQRILGDALEYRQPLTLDGVAGLGWVP